MSTLVTNRIQSVAVHLAKYGPKLVLELSRELDIPPCSLHKVLREMKETGTVVHDAVPSTRKPAHYYRLAQQPVFVPGHTHRVIHTKAVDGLAPTLAANDAADPFGLAHRRAG